MKTYTLGFLFRNRKIILAKKKRKIGVGKWNGYGGRVEEGEDRPECLTREIREESGVIVAKEQCKELGYIDFYFQNKNELNQRVYIYHLDEFTGEPKETVEMGKPEEFDLDQIPFKEMMVGDNKFMPFVIEGKRFRGEIYFSENGENLIRYVLEGITDENNEIKIK